MSSVSPKVLPATNFYPSLQLVPGDLVVDPGVHDVAGPLGHALDHLDDVVSEILISKLHSIHLIPFQLFLLLHNLHFTC